MSISPLRSTPVHYCQCQVISCASSPAPSSSRCTSILTRPSTSSAVWRIRKQTDRAACCNISPDLAACYTQQQLIPTCSHNLFSLYLLQSASDARFKSSTEAVGEMKGLFQPFVASNGSQGSHNIYGYYIFAHLHQAFKKCDILVNGLNAMW